MRPSEIIECLELNPIIAAIRDDGWEAALHSPAQVLFYLSADLTTVADRIRQAHEAQKILLIHMDLAEGIGRDRYWPDLDRDAHPSGSRSGQDQPAEDRERCSDLCQKEA